MIDLEKIAQSDLAEQVIYAVNGFNDADDAVSDIESLEHEFDGDSVCPYYHQQDEVIRDYESDWWQDTSDITGETKYKAEEWQEAKTAYAYAVAYCAYSAAYEEAKTALLDAIREFVDDAVRELKLDDEPRIQISSSSTLGWAAHDRELADGTMIFESLQLDGCNGIERELQGVFISTVVNANET